MVIPCWEKKDCQSCNWWSYVQSCRLYYDLLKEIRRKRYFPLLFPVPLAPLLSTLPLPSSLSLFLAPTVCIPSFYNFLFSLAARQIASRSMNFLERSRDCLSMFLLPPLFFLFLFLTFMLLSLLFFLNPCNVGHSSWEASGKNRVPPATRVYARHLYINHVSFKHLDEFGQNMFIPLYQLLLLQSLVKIYYFQDILNVFHRWIFSRLHFYEQKLEVRYVVSWDLMIHRIFSWLSGFFSSYFFKISAVLSTHWLLESDSRY